MADEDLGIRKHSDGGTAIATIRSNGGKVRVERRIHRKKGWSLKRSRMEEGRDSPPTIKFGMGIGERN